VGLPVDDPVARFNTIVQKIIDPDLAGLENINEEVGLKTGFEFLTHRLDFFGIYRECQNKR